MVTYKLHLIRHGMTDGNRTGKLIDKFADLFIYQWEQLASIYPNGVYGGGIY